MRRFWKWSWIVVLCLLLATVATLVAATFVVLQVGGALVREREHYNSINYSNAVGRVLHRIVISELAGEPADLQRPKAGCTYIKQTKTGSRPERPHDVTSVPHITNLVGFARSVATQRCGFMDIHSRKLFDGESIIVDFWYFDGWTNLCASFAAVAARDASAGKRFLLTELRARQIYEAQKEGFRQENGPSLDMLGPQGQLGAYPQLEAWWNRSADTPPKSTGSFNYIAVALDRAAQISGGLCTAELHGEIVRIHVRLNFQSRIGPKR